MLPPPRVERLALPPVPAAPARSAFPLAASVAPVVVSLGIWAVTGSPYSLLFAALGPVVALGSLLDGRRHRRRTVRRDRRRALAAIARVVEQVQAVNSRERDRLDRLAPTVQPDAVARRAVESWSRGALSGDARETPLPVRLGRAELDPVVELTGDPDEDAPSALRDAIAGLRRSAERLVDVPWLVDARDGVGLLGPSSAAHAVARSLVVQLLVQCSPASSRLIAPADEHWVAELPHRVVRAEQPSYRVICDGREAIIAWGRDAGALPPGLGRTIRVGPGPDPASDGDSAGPRAVAYGALTAARARELAQTLAAVARDHSVVDLSAAIPESVTLAELLAAPSGRETSARGADLRAPIGVGSGGVVELDLVREGPHAVVAGTTGTGKSELLVSWVLAMAWRHPPTDVTFLLIDFKGGAAFAPLARVPHVVGIVSDLDARRSRRAIESLRSELRRRELLLAERGVRSIDEMPGELARLVIVVDEFAAVVSDRPELHEVFSDLAARGRSLGLHLVLCTQRPAGVIRDGVLANVTLRISLRVTDRGDSTAMLGSDAAFALPPAPRGRAVIADGSGVVREVQLALADHADAERLRVVDDVWPSTAPASPPVWRDPLPEVLRLDELRHDPDWGRAPGIPFGRLDLPAEQRQPLAVHDPTTDGHLLVLGAARAGRTTALATFAVDPRCRVLPSDPADAWSVLDELVRRTTDGLAAGVAGGAAERTVLVIDDLDVLIDRVDPDARHEFVDLLARIARESRRIGLIVSAQRLTSPLQRLAGLFDSRLLLRQPSRDEHVLAGGDGATFDPRLPPGAGTWRGGSTIAATVQLAIGIRQLPAAAVPELPSVRPEPGVALAVVAGRPRELLKAIEPASPGILAPRVIRVGEESLRDGDGDGGGGGGGGLRVSHGEPLVLVGDPDAWQAEWALLAEVRRESPLVFSGCTAAEARTIARVRGPLPPLGDRPGECWLVEGGDVRRAILEL